MGEAIYSLLGDSFLYFIPISLVDAMILNILIKSKKDYRSILYASLCFLSIILHFIGGAEYIADADMNFYSIGLILILIGKLMLLDKAILDARDYTLNFASDSFNRMVCSSYRLAYT